LDPGWVKNQDPGSGSGMNSPDHIPRVKRNKKFLVKILKFFDVDSGFGMEKIRIRDPGWKKFGLGIRDEKFGSE
jgi:hypothetical protein